MAALKDGYKKQIAGQGAGSDDYVLLAGGGHKALSEIISNSSGLDNNSLEGFLYQSNNNTGSIGSIVTSEGQIAIPYTYYENAVAKYAGTTDLFYKSGATFYIGTGVKSTYFVGVAGDHVPTGTAGGSAAGGGEGSGGGTGTGGASVSVIDALNSTSTTAALSARQGQVLNTTTVHLAGNESISGIKTFTGGGSDGANPSILARYGITTGGTNITGYSGMQAIRKCASDGNYINTAGFIVNADGSAKFAHRRGTTSAVSNTDDSYITFDATGGWIAYSGTKGSAVSDAQKYKLIDSNNISEYLTTLPTLADVATSGSYNDLTDTPTIPSLDGYATQQWVLEQGYSTSQGGPVDTSNLATVATTGSYNDLLDKPTIPTSISDLTTDKYLPFNDSYINDCNTWLTNGYTKTHSNSSGFTSATINLPSLCTGTDKWGILFFIAENVEQGTGTQMYFPIDGTYKGRVFTRSLTNMKQGSKSIGTWTLLMSNADTYSKTEIDTMIGNINSILESI